MSEYKLGRWDLSELAKNPKSAEFQKQVQELEKMANSFEKIKTKLDPKMSSKKFIRYSKTSRNNFRKNEQDWRICLIIILIRHTIR